MTQHVSYIVVYIANVVTPANRSPETEHFHEICTTQAVIFNMTSSSLILLWRFYVIKSSIIVVTHAEAQEMAVEQANCDNYL